MCDPNYVSCMWVIDGHISWASGLPCCEDFGLAKWNIFQATVFALLTAAITFLYFCPPASALGRFIFIQS